MTADVGVPVLARLGRSPRDLASQAEGRGFESHRRFTVYAAFGNTRWSSFDDLPRWEPIWADESHTHEVGEMWTTAGAALHNPDHGVTRAQTMCAMRGSPSAIVPAS